MSVNLAEIPRLMTDKQSENSVFRILDATINRAGEGIRVVEDYVRMELGDQYLARELKQLRHDLTESVSSIDPVQRIAARDSVGDVGRTIQVESEYRRDQIPGADSLDPSPPHQPSGGMIQANMTRAQQALRTIEEFSKTLDGGIATAVEQLRYRAYTIEKSVLTTVVSLQNLAEANLYALIDGRHAESDQAAGLLKLVKQLVDAEVSIIQLRDKTMTDRQLVEAGQAITKITRGSQTRFIMNDRADLAVAVNADGVHLGQHDLSVSAARRVVGASKMIGVSTHSIEQARQAVLDGANYIGVGPVFASSTKQFKTHVGLELVKSVAEEVRLPAFAIGGIDLQNVRDVVNAGMRRVAVSAALVNADQPGAVAKQFNSALVKR